MGVASGRQRQGWDRVEAPDRRRCRRQYGHGFKRWPADYFSLQPDRELPGVGSRIGNREGADADARPKWKSVPLDFWGRLEDRLRRREPKGHLRCPNERRRGGRSLRELRFTTKLDEGREQRTIPRR